MSYGEISSGEISGGAAYAVAVAGGGVVTVIDAVIWIAIGVGVVIAIAVVVGIVDAANAAMWRQVASERRQRWESRYPEYSRGSEDD